MPHEDLFDLTGRVAILSGGAGILGRRFTQALVARGASVLVIDRDVDRLAALEAELADTAKARVATVAGDITRREEWQRFAAMAVARFGGIDALINNAAAKSANFFEPFDSFPLADWDEVMTANVTGAMLGCQVIGAHLAAKGRGAIVNVLSIYGVAAPDQRIYEGSLYEGHAINTPAVYSVSKAALWGLTMYLAGYWADRGVRVNAISPGGVFSGQNDVFVRRYSARVPMGRMAHEDEMNGALIYLLSDAATYTTGQNIVVDGGLTVW